jgi:hypothetical protein
MVGFAASPQFVGVTQDECWLAAKAARVPKQKACRADRPNVAVDQQLQFEKSRTINASAFACARFFDEEKSRFAYQRNRGRHKWHGKLCRSADNFLSRFWFFSHG